MDAKELITKLISKAIILSLEGVALWLLWNYVADDVFGARSLSYTQVLSLFVGFRLMMMPRK